MILVDYNQVVISNLMVQTKGQLVPDEDLVRHMVLNSLRSYIKQFKNEYGELVICCDNKKHWRKDLFPFYKASRRKARSEQSAVDWHTIHIIMAKIRLELKEYFPHKVIEVEGAEADDVIATLALRQAAHEKVLVISSDQDFHQLLKHKNIKQYNQILKTFIKEDDPQAFLKTKIIKGDRGDGIPNILSPRDCFVRGVRQTPINSKKLEEWIHQNPVDFCRNEVILSNYECNRKLIDLELIPTDVSKNIIEAYETATVGSKRKMMDYFVEKKLGLLIGDLGDF